MAVNSTASQKEYKQLKKKQHAKREEKSSNHPVVKGIFAIALIVIAMVLVGMSGAFTISEIVVEGNETLSQEQIISFSGIEKGMNLFAVSKRGVVRKIKENSYVDTVEVKRCLPNKIRLRIQERKAEYALPLGNSFVYIDRNGYVIEISDRFSGIPILAGFVTDLSQIKENDRLVESDYQAMKTLAKIRKTAGNHEIGGLISKMDISDQENYTMYLETEGKIVYLGNGTELNTRFLYIKKILQRERGKTGIIFANVDLPLPFLPRMDINCPLSTCSVRWSNTCRESMTSPS